ncbi:YciI family protein [Roseateles violae]|uniref:YciI family protein n=1 Tax=Roseateles violae TaxID=3058042 RepID=A0ABT8DLK5_9BURK|nr:YciI family protein [Pelomonas sp. PFR6]MDN3918783.1 YciI family protein [Pelomonas sp. PFR6]
MAKFLTIGYGDEAGYKRTDPAVLKAAHANDARLKAAGALMGVAGTAVQVRKHNDEQLQTIEGPYMHSALPIAGFAVIEAADLQEAIRLVSGSPCAVAYGLVEVWPMESMP